jgi:hypothetical protein
MTGADTRRALPWKPPAHVVTMAFHASLDEMHDKIDVGLVCLSLVEARSFKLARTEAIVI